MNRHPRWILIAPLFALLLAGCGTGTAPLAPPGSGEAPPASADEQEVSAQLALHPDLVDDGVFANPEPVSLSGSAGTEGVFALIHPLTYWRTILHVDRRVEFHFAEPDAEDRPTLAIATIHKFLRGSFNILAGTGSGLGDHTDAEVVRKRLADHWVRRVLLRRIEVPEQDHPVWRIVAASGVKITSFAPVSTTPANAYGHTRLVSLRLEAGDRDTTITDPLGFFRLPRLLWLEAGAEVRLTATTLRANDIVVFQHHLHRFPFRNNGDGTHTAMWKVPMLAGVRHLAVNALSRGTLFDDQAPYDSQAWVLPYAVAPIHLADASR